MDGTLTWRLPDPQKSVGSKFDASIRIADTLERRAGVTVDRSAGRDAMLYAFAPIANTDLVAYTNVPLESVYSEGRREAILALAVTSATLLLAAALSWRIARRIALPIRAVAEGAKRIVGGELDVRLEERGPAELVDIAREINRTVEARAQAEVALRRSEERFRCVFDRAAEGIGILREQRVAQANEAAGRMSGIGTEPMLGLDLIELAHPDDRQRLLEWRESCAGGSSGGEPCECRFVGPDGALVWAELKSSRIDWDGRAACAVIFSDVSERKRTDLALRAARDDREAMLNALPDLMFKFDRTGGIEDFHSSAPEMLYLPPSTFLGRAVGDVLPAGAAQVIMAAIEEAASTGSSRGMTYALPIAGEMRWFEVSMAPMPAPLGRPGHFILPALDPT